jgi:3-dehydroquinate dehydratase
MEQHWASGVAWVVLVPVVEVRHSNRHARKNWRYSKREPEVLQQVIVWEYKTQVFWLTALLDKTRQFCAAI